MTIWEVPESLKACISHKNGEKQADNEETKTKKSLY